MKLFKVALHPTVLALGAVSLFNDMSSDMLWPLLPAFLATKLGAGAMLLGWVEGIGDTTASLLNLWAGSLADRFPRRKPLALAGYIVSTAARGFMAVATASWHVVAVRFTDRIGKGLRSSPRDAMIADVTPTETRGTAFGFHRAMDHCGALLGPILAYLLLRHAGVALETVFLWAVLPGALGVLVLGLAVREEPREGVPARRSGEQGLRPTGRFRAYLLLVCLFTLGNSSDSFLILRAHELGMTVALAPILSALLHVVKALASTPGGWLSDRLGRRPLLILGWALYAALYAVVGFTSSLAGLWIVVTVYGLYYGLTEGVQKAWVADLVEPAQRGVAFGWYHTAIGIGALPANVLFGIVWKTWGSAAAFVVAAGFAALAVLGLLLFVTTTPRAPGPSTPD